MHSTAALRGLYRKMRLTTKDMNKGFYRGSRTGTVGKHTKYGGFKIDYKRVRSYVCPSLEGFKLTPFVTEKITKPFGQYTGDKAGPRSPENYLARWKTENGLD